MAKKAKKSKPLTKDERIELQTLRAAFQALRLVPAARLSDYVYDVRKGGDDAIAAIAEYLHRDDLAFRAARKYKNRRKFVAKVRKFIKGDA